MKRIALKKILSLLTFLLLSNLALAQDDFITDYGAKKTNSAGANTTVINKSLSPYFSPPERYDGEFGTYRSPLLFYNDKDTVKTAEDWVRRRTEIKNRWNKMMGAWPPFLKDQRLTILDTVDRDGFTQYKVAFYWVPGQRTEGYLLIPDGRKVQKIPAVITVYYEPETAVGWGRKDLPNRDFAYQLARRGFVTLSLGTSKASKEKVYSIYYPDIDHAEVQPLSMLAYAAANAWYVLSKVPEVDSNRIGIMGHSFGGKWAMFASCLFDKFAAAVWSDPGIVFDETKDGLINYWEPWYLGYYPPPWKNTWRETGMISSAKGLYPKLIREGYDLQELHALMAPRPFLVSGGEADQVSRWPVLNHSIRVNNILGYKDRVAMSNVRQTHAPTPQSNKVAVDFLTYFLQGNGVD